MANLKTVQRLHYFDHQFLREQDFTAEQDYHLGMRRLHNQLLHTWGIADGLDVSFEAGATSVKVAPGVALDSDGQELVLVAEEVVELESFPPDASVYVTIAYEEQKTDPTSETGGTGDTRWTEKPRVAGRQTAPQVGSQVVLALVSRSGTEVKGLDTSKRRFAGAVGGTFEVLGLTLRDPTIVPGAWVRMRLERAKRAIVEGSLRITEDLMVDVGATFPNGLSWGSRASRLVDDQGGSIELGAGTGVAGEGTPYIDFHYQDKTEDYNIRLINDADRQLSLDGNLRITRGLTLSNDGGSLTLRRAVVNIGTTDGSLAQSGEVVGAIGFLGSGVQHGELAFRAGNGFELVDPSSTVPRLDFTRGSLPYADLRVRQLVWAQGSRLVDDQGGSVELGGYNDRAGVGTPYIDFHFLDKTEDFNVRLVNDMDGWLTAVGHLRVTRLVESESIELRSAFGMTPYVDFHFENRPGDYNVRLINDADRQLRVDGNLNVSGWLSVMPPGPAPYPRNPYFADGEAHVAGAAGGWSFANRDTAEEKVFDDVAGQRWVLYSSASTARLWTARTGDCLVVDPNGNLIVRGAIGANGYQQTPHNQGWHGIRCWDLEAEGSIWTAHGIHADGGKGGYVVDTFINNTGEPLEEGDVVIISPGQSGASSGLRGNIPIPEVDPATEAYDSRVCGIVSQVRGEMALPEGAPKRRSRKKPAFAELELQRYAESDIDEIGHAEVKPGQVGEMVTLGAFSHCKVDAKYGAIEVGDLLTTSPTPGHAQKVLEPQRAVGAIIAKALAPVPKGRKKIPVIVVMQ